MVTFQDLGGTLYRLTWKGSQRDLSDLSDNVHNLIIIGPLHDSVTWYKIIHAGEKLRSGTSKTKAGSGGLVRVALFWKSHCATCKPACRGDFVPCDRIAQRAYYRMRYTCIFLL